MAKFFIGCPVRVTKVHRASSAHLLGMEGRVTEVWEDFMPGEPGYGLDICPISHDGMGFVSLGGHQLEPIQPSGHRAGDYSLSDLLDRCRAGEGVAA